MGLTNSMKIGSSRVRRWGQGAWAWARLRPGTRPRRVVRAMIVRSATILRAHPRVAAGLNGALRRFPAIHGRLRLIVHSAGRTSAPIDLSRHGKEVRSALAAALERHARRAR